MHSEMLGRNRIESSSERVNWWSQAEAFERRSQVLRNHKVNYSWINIVLTFRFIRIVDKECIWIPRETLWEFRQRSFYNNTE
jgi:hypothetical protein